MIRSPVRRHHHHRSKSPTRRSPKHEREREREHRSSHSAKEKRSHEEEENGRHHHHHHRGSREQEHVKERSHREKDSSTERSRDREEVSVDRRRNSTSRGELEKERHIKERERPKRNRSRSQSPPMDSNRSRVRPTSPVSPPRRSRSRVHDEASSPRGDEHRNEDDSVAKMKAAEEALEAKKKEEPSFELSGKLAEETNRVRGVALLFTEPPDARKPDIRWRLYVFKAGEVLNEPLYIHRQSCYLFGRERRVADVPTDHPSCSKQHAVIQFRLVEKELPDGMLSKQVRPYLMDLGSTNGTFLNENRIESQRYYELFEKDTIKFGNSSREYVMLHENSA